MGEQLQKITQQALASELAILWTTSQFFTTLQNIMLEKNLPPDTNLAELHARMEKLAGQDASAASSVLIEAQRALQHARASLAIIDGRISVSVIRRFFERVGDFDPNSLKHIVRYYLSKPAKDENDRDKTDLLVTRLCSFVITTNTSLKTRQVVKDLEELLEELSRSKRGIELESVQAAIISKLQQYGRSILDARSFNNLIEGKLIPHLREYKISLGDTFYAPMVLAEIVKVNIAVHNKFQELYYLEQARLRMETARMLRSLQNTGEFNKVEHPTHPMVGQLSGLTVQMQQFLQDLKRDLAEQILEDRVARASMESGSSITVLIGSLEESLKRSRELLKKLQEVYTSTGDREVHQ
jgi:hypothetical protein